MLIPDQVAAPSWMETTLVSAPPPVPPGERPAGGHTVSWVVLAVLIVAIGLMFAWIIRRRG